jgi:CHAD domain-containing protein
LSATTSIATLPQPEASARNGQNRAALERLLHDRLRKFMSLLPKVLAEDSVEAVHDLRVWSRRLQQVVSTLSANPLPSETRTMVRALRRARRALGGWRDCDVLIDLLERKARRVRNPEEKKAYAMIRDLALSKRDRGIRRARRKLANRKLFTLGHRAGKFLEELAHDERQDAAQVMASAAAARYAEWRQALSRACESFDPVEVHAFRIRTKQLRYRIELARDLGERDAEPALEFLKSLQDVLGSWHDQVELLRLTAEALADSEFLLKHARLVALLLRKSDREQMIQNRRVRRLLANTNESAQASALDHWMARYCREMPALRPSEPQEREPQQMRESVSCPNELPVAQDLEVAQDGDSAGAPDGDSAGSLTGADAPVLAANPAVDPALDPAVDPAGNPIEDFVKAMSEMPR